MRLFSKTLNNKRKENDLTTKRYNLQKRQIHRYGLNRFVMRSFQFPILEWSQEVRFCKQFRL